MNETELGWVAGIFEGEGTCGVYGPYAPDLSKNNRKGKMSVASVDRDVIDSLRRLTGVGTVCPRPKTHKNPKHQDQWVWQVQKAKDVLALCEALYPLMHGRRRLQMEPVLEWGREWVASRP